jgi:hypothetical protein
MNKRASIINLCFGGAPALEPHRSRIPMGGLCRSQGKKENFVILNAEFARRITFCLVFEQEGLRRPE